MNGYSNVGIHGIYRITVREDYVKETKTYYRTINLHGAADEFSPMGHIDLFAQEGTPLADEIKASIYARDETIAGRASEEAVARGHSE